jgi:hypothetical protein
MKSMNNFDLKKFLVENKLTSNSRLKEGTFDEGEIALFLGPAGLTHVFKRGSGYYGYNDEFDFEAKDREELEQELKGYELTAGSLDEGVKTTDYAHYKKLKAQGIDVELVTKDDLKKSKLEENTTTTVWSNLALQFLIDNKVRYVKGVGGNPQIDWHLIALGFGGAEEKALGQLDNWKASMEHSLGIEPHEEVRIEGGVLTTDKIDQANDEAGAAQASAMKKGGFSNN